VESSSPGRAPYSLPHPGEGSELPGPTLLVVKSEAPLQTPVAVCTRNWRRQPRTFMTQDRLRPRVDMGAPRCNSGARLGCTCHNVTKPKDNTCGPRARRGRAISCQNGQTASGFRQQADWQQGQTGQLVNLRTEYNQYGMVSRARGPAEEVVPQRLKLHRWTASHAYQPNLNHHDPAEGHAPAAH
jgi:hypothetical protein